MVEKHAFLCLKVALYFWNDKQNENKFDHLTSKISNSCKNTHTIYKGILTISASTSDSLWSKSEGQ